MARKNRRQELTAKEKLYVHFFNGSVKGTQKILQRNGLKNFTLDVCYDYNKKPRVKLAIEKKFNRKRKTKELTDDELKNFWVHKIETSDNEYIQMKASENLGKTKKMFVDKVEVSADEDLAELILKRRRKK